MSLVCLGFPQRRLLPWVNFIHSILKILMRRLEHRVNIAIMATISHVK